MFLTYGSSLNSTYLSPLSRAMPVVTFGKQFRDISDAFVADRMFLPRPFTSVTYKLDLRAYAAIVKALGCGRLGVCLWRRMGRCAGGCKGRLRVVWHNRVGLSAKRGRLEMWRSPEREGRGVVGECRCVWRDALSGFELKTRSLSWVGDWYFLREKSIE